MGDQWRYLCHLGTPMLARDQRTPFSEWWWTVDRLLLAAIIALILGGVILSLAASPPVATRIGLDPFHFFNRHVLFLLPSFSALANQYSGFSFLLSFGPQAPCTPDFSRRSITESCAAASASIAACGVFAPDDASPMFCHHNCASFG